MRKIIKAIEEELLKKIQQKNGEVSVYITIDGGVEEITKIENGIAFYENDFGDQKIEIDFLFTDDLLNIYEALYGQKD